MTDTELRDFVAKVPEHVLVVVDEAYREFVRSDDPIDGLALQAAHANVAVMRTFAKAYGLAGFRVGYLVGHAEVAAAVRACALPFGVSTIAQAAAVASLAAEAELLERVRVDRGRARPGGRRPGRAGLGLPGRRRATSSGCPWGSAHRSSSLPPRRPASRCGRSPVKGFG